jgi:deazaflavin-dependent oxidoreductase (nitroreductase family)
LALGYLAQMTSWLDQAFRPYAEPAYGGTLWGMRGSIQSALRSFTRTMRPLALRSAGKEGSNTSVVRHVGRRSGQAYSTPVIAVQHDDSFLIALPYGQRTDWLKNVLSKGSATIVSNGHAYEVDRPEVVPMRDATAYFRPREQRMHRQFHVDAALQLRLRPVAHS